MPSGPNQDEINVSQILTGFRLDMRFILGGAVILGIVAAIFTMVVPPIFESRMSIVFPSRSSDMQARLPSFVQAESPSGLLYVGGLLDSRAGREAIGEPLSLNAEEVRESLRVEPQLQSRQLWVSFRSQDGRAALSAMENAREFLVAQETSTQVGISEARLAGIRQRLAEKIERVETLRADLTDYLKASDTVPTSEDGFTGGGILKQLQDAQAKLSEVDDRIKARKEAAQKIGLAGAEGLPTGMELERPWREKLLAAEVAFDEAKAKYRPGTPQFEEARTTLVSVRDSIRKEVEGFVSSVLKGADQEMAYLVAERTVLAMQISNLESKASKAPIEASEFRRLLDEIEAERAALLVIKAEEEEELLTMSTMSRDWLILDEPYLLEEPVNKSLVLNCGVAGLVGAILGMVFSPRRKTA